MTRAEQIEQAARIYGHDNPNSHWNADAEYEVDYDIPAEDFKAGALWSDANPDLYSVTRKAVERERAYLIGKACKWLSEHFYDEEYQSCDNEGTWICAEEMIRDLRKAMEEQQ